MRQHEDILALQLAQIEGAMEGQRSRVGRVSLSLHPDYGGLGSLEVGRPVVGVGQSSVEVTERAEKVALRMAPVGQWGILQSDLGWPGWVFEQEEIFSLLMIR